MGKLKDKITKMNPKKAFCNFVVCTVIFCIIAGLGTVVKFGSRIPEIKQQIKEIKNSEEKSKQDNRAIDAGEENSKKAGNHESDHENEWKNLITFTRSDYIFIGCVIGGFWIIFCIYWLYTVAYAVSKSWEVGANAWIFGLLTLATNLLGVAFLWLYIKIHLVCPGCGKLQTREANYCTNCGSAIYVKCPECGIRISTKDAYCHGCGRKMDYVWSGKHQKTNMK